MGLSFDRSHPKEDTVLGRIVLLAILGAGALSYLNIRQEAPDPYAPCAKKATDAERKQCRNTIDFAMSAGW
jgi:hypothetical protein